VSWDSHPVRFEFHAAMTFGGDVIKLEESLRVWPMGEKTPGDTPRILRVKPAAILVATGRADLLRFLAHWLTIHPEDQGFRMLCADMPGTSMLFRLPEVMTPEHTSTTTVIR
jgi:hypothetical protein